MLIEYACSNQNQNQNAPVFAPPARGLALGGEQQGQGGQKPKQEQTQPSTQMVQTTQPTSHAASKNSDSIEDTKHQTAVENIIYAKRASAAVLALDSNNDANSKTGSKTRTYEDWHSKSPRVPMSVSSSKSPRVPMAMGNAPKAMGNVPNVVGVTGVTVAVPELNANAPVINKNPNTSLTGATLAQLENLKAEEQELPTVISTLAVADSTSIRGNVNNNGATNATNPPKAKKAQKINQQVSAARNFLQVLGSSSGGQLQNPAGPNMQRVPSQQSVLSVLSAVPSMGESVLEAACTSI